MSSSVGPRPPVVITTLDRRTASLIASSRRASSSPTIVLSLTSIPRRLSFSVSQRLLVSVRSGARSSDPIAMISAVRVSNKRDSLISGCRFVLVDVVQHFRNRRWRRDRAQRRRRRELHFFTLFRDLGRWRRVCFGFEETTALHQQLAGGPLPRSLQAA